MNIHEYQAKEILKSFAVSVPNGHLALTEDAAVQAAQSLGGSLWVVKAQIHAGGRGKAGGVRICKSLDEVKAAANALLGSVLVTKQTGAAGKEVGKVYIEEGLDIASEFYLSLLVDRESECVSFVVSPAGGMDIEEVAANQPEKIATFPIRDINTCDTGKMASFLGLHGDAVTQFDGLVRKLYQLFVESDAAMLELNPLVLTGSGDLVALDAKFVADDNALYRQEAIVAMRDLSEEDPREIEAAQFGLNYIQLDGNIGCMVNGAGLAMATMDMIHMKGEEPANFLDVGGGVTVPAVTEAFKLLFSDKHVKAVLVNIFGGIVRCDIIAQGLLEAIKTHPMSVPVVMRLVGTNEEAGQKLIKDAGLDVYWADDLDEAASIAVKVIGE
ncbi:MAG: ADP-forming succinate--CoA ligase subunit beta [Proteobacteria bacterium]|nr:ADP-forming succinate--CoA ligase subunit beta [bacterium AH-315-G11]PCI43742.1 MAG: ADP-forming succinate--CoA ligase subunit beta [Pseudomonadota bacterium]